MTQGTAFLDVIAFMANLRNRILDNKAPLELDTVHKDKDGKGEILRYKKDREQQSQGEQNGKRKGALIYIHGGAYAFGSPGKTLQVFEAFLWFQFQQVCDEQV